jgi:hypothetical protein
VPVGSQERALDVHTEHPGAAEVSRQRGGPAQRGDEVRHRCGDEGGHERGDAGLRQPAGHLGPTGRVSGDEVDPETAVDLDVDQARDQDAGRKVHVRADATVRLARNDTHDHTVRNGDTGRSERHAVSDDTRRVYHVHGNLPRAGTLTLCTTVWSTSGLDRSIPVRRL